MLNKNQIAEFEKLCRPVSEFLRDNCHPHCQAIINEFHIQLTEDMYSTPVNIGEYKDKKV